jgi:hypothetical protein
MPDQLTLSTESIEGIGPATAASLKRGDIHTVGDLLRINSVRIDEVAGAKVSLERVRSWCEMAALLQVEGITPQWAEALNHADIRSVADLADEGLPSLRKHFRAAKKAGRIPEVPKDAEICEMLKDAAVISLTGALSATILGDGDRPVAEAAIRIGRQTRVTDARGRFRVTRIPLWTNPTMVVTHPEHRPGRFRLGRLNPSHVVNQQTFRVRPAPAGRPSPSTVRMEVRGEVLPPLGDGPIRARSVEREELIDGDVLAVVEFSADRKRAKLVSKLLVYEDGVFRFPYAWFPVSELEPGAKPGDCYLLRRGELRATPMSPVRLSTWRAMLRAKRTMGRPEGRTADQWVEDAVEALARAGRRGR